MNVFSAIKVSLKSCNICQRAILQNIAHLHYIDLYDNIFQRYDKFKYRPSFSLYLVYFKSLPA